MNEVFAVFSDENEIPLIIYSDKAKYNNINYNTNFYENVKITYLNHNINSDKLDLNFKENIVKADEFLNSLDEKNKSSKKMICLTFDDSIKSQANVALEVLDDLKMKAFFFVNTFDCCKCIPSIYWSNKSIGAINFNNITDLRNI